MKHLALKLLPIPLATGCLLSLCGTALAQPIADTAASQQPPPMGLHWVDWLLIALYALATIGLGVYYGRQQTSTDEYFRGSGHMNPILIGVSLFATLLSTISYLSMPGEASGKGPVAMVGLLAYPLVFVVVAYVLLPVYMRQRVTSAYELLETRLGLSVRLLGASMFLALRLVWMTLLVYLAAKAMTVMMGTDYWQFDFQQGTAFAGQFGRTAEGGDELRGWFAWNGATLRVASIPVIVFFTGVVSVIYTTLGGLRAVVITDLLQTILLFGGAVLVVLTVTWEFGGFGWFPSEWQPTWDAQPIFSFDPKTRVTVVGTILSILAWQVATAGGDQTAVQRFMATRDAAAARRAVATQLGVGMAVQLTLFLVGFALLGYFLAHRGELPAGMNVKDNADDLFPRYISYHLPVGVSGLVVAAMFAAAMSSIDSGVNSITAVVLTDFVDRLGWRTKTERSHVREAKLLALAIGLTVVLGSSLMKYIEGNITAVTNKTVNLLTTPIFALFVFALFVPRARAAGVWVGAICGVLTAFSIAFSGPLVYLLHVWLGVDPAVFNVALITQVDPATGQTWTTAEDPISFQWIGPVALAVNLAAGSLVCWLLPRKPAHAS